MPSRAVRGVPFPRSGRTGVRRWPCPRCLWWSLGQRQAGSQEPAPDSTPRATSRTTSSSRRVVWRDYDLRIENNHAQGDYTEYYAGRSELAPHYLTRGADGEIYSVHPVGLPVLLAPIYAAGGYLGVRAALICISSLVAFLLLVWLRRLGVVEGACAVRLGRGGHELTPFVFFSFAVYPEMVAGLLVLSCPCCSSLSASNRPPSRISRSRSALALAVGRHRSVRSCLALAEHQVRTHGGSDRPGRDSQEPGRTGATATCRAPTTRTGRRLSQPPAASRRGSCSSPCCGALTSPSAPYGTRRQHHDPPPGRRWAWPDRRPGVRSTRLRARLCSRLHRLRRACGGLAARRAVWQIELGIVASVRLSSSVGAFHIWWGGSAPPGRPIVSILPNSRPAGSVALWPPARGTTRCVRPFPERYSLVTSASVTLLLATTQARATPCQYPRRDLGHCSSTSRRCGRSPTSCPASSADPTLTAWALAGLWGGFAWLGVRVLTRFFESSSWPDLRRVCSLNGR